MFKDLIKLLFLHLEHNSLKSLNEYSFKSLTELRTIRLFHNQISRIEPNAFQELKSLFVLKSSTAFALKNCPSNFKEKKQDF